MYGQKPKSRIWKFFRTLMMSVSVLVICGMLADGLRGNRVMVTMKEDSLMLSLEEENTFEIPFRSIHALYLEKDFDIGECVEGIENRNYYYGRWRNEALGDYILCMNRNTSDVMLVETEDGMFAVSIESDQMTADYLTEFSEILEEWRDLNL